MWVGLRLYACSTAWCGASTHGHSDPLSRTKTTISNYIRLQGVPVYNNYLKARYFKTFDISNWILLKRLELWKRKLWNKMLLYLYVKVEKSWIYRRKNKWKKKVIRSNENTFILHDHITTSLWIRLATVRLIPMVFREPYLASSLWQGR